MHKHKITSISITCTTGYWYVDVGRVLAAPVTIPDPDKIEGVRTITNTLTTHYSVTPSSVRRVIRALAALAEDYSANAARPWAIDPHIHLKP